MLVLMTDTDRAIIIARNRVVMALLAVLRDPRPSGCVLLRADLAAARNRLHILENA
jgi:hypothetical protein